MYESFFALFFDLAIEIAKNGLVFGILYKKERKCLSLQQSMLCSELLK